MMGNGGEAYFAPTETSDKLLPQKTIQFFFSFLANNKTLKTPGKAIRIDQKRIRVDL